MGQALYRKYRPKSLDEVAGQTHITTTLGRAIKNGKISHAYLFTGPRGTGKTSVARILAHAVNGLDYTDEPHLDIIEIDAASNRRIDEIRDIRDKVSTAPVAAKYKVYIIDEVHMLTKEAFNALLKTLEEPPAHVIFILATTEAYKLPETIISRTQRYSFKPIGKSEAIQQLTEISKQEGIKISKEALELIVQHGDGSLRDSTSLLDQAANQADKIELSDIERMLGLAPADIIAKLLESVEKAESAAVITNLQSIFEQGYEAAAVAAQLSEPIRLKLLDGKLAINNSAALDLLRSLLEVPSARNPKRLLELALLKHTLAEPAGPGAKIARALPVEQLEPEPIVEPAPSTTLEPKPVKATESVVLPTPAASKPSPSKPLAADSTDIWPLVLNDIKKDHNTLYGIARMARVEIDQDKVTLYFRFAFHRKKAGETKNKQILAESLHNVSGKNYGLDCLMDELVSSDVILPVEESSASEPIVSSISNIFGGAELLES
ncbi:MAG: DNA polymerase III subunit gamma/tau [Candidatus Saccharimonadales bacterium]